jgi:DNA (cytosine-5)-methyltransferase 1
MKKLKILDLFAGVGGFSMGFEMVRDKRNRQIFELFKAVEVDEHACLTLGRNFGRNKVIKGDLTEKKVHKRVIKECKDNVDIIVGGIPCQSFSLIGPRSGYGIDNDKFRRDKRDRLYKEYVSLVKELKPVFIIFENVKGILSKKDSKGGKIIDRIINDLEKLGYSFRNENPEITKIITLNAADFGVPQKRERVFLIGNRVGIVNPYPKKTHFNQKSKKANILEQRGLLPYVSLLEAIGDLPKIKAKISYKGLTKKRRIQIIKRNLKRHSGEDLTKSKRKKFIKHYKMLDQKGKQFLDFVRPNGYPYIHHHVSRYHQLTDILLFKQMKEGTTSLDILKAKDKKLMKLIKYSMNSFKDKYKKQGWKSPSSTIFAHLEKDGNRFIHPDSKQARTFTPREAARIQSFPDSFVFEGPYSKKFRQIGNAVPPLLSKNIAEAIVKVMQ